MSAFVSRVRFEFHKHTLSPLAETASCQEHKSRADSSATKQLRGRGNALIGSSGGKEGGWQKEQEKAAA